LIPATRSIRLAIFKNVSLMVNHLTYYAD